MKENIMNRRTLLTGTILGAAGLALANCTTAQVTQFETEWATIAGDIQSAVSTAAGYIPTIESVAETAASLFGPSYVTLVTAGSAAFNQIVATLEAVVANLTPPASAKLHARLKASSPAAPIAVGVTTTGVTVIGWKS
jgi:hypothetical protein